MFGNVAGFRSCLLGAVFLMAFSGCRIPKMFLTPPGSALVYDTAFEHELAGQTEPPRDSTDYDFKWRYRDSLAEPVTVVSYEKDVASQWNVLFATNRTPEQHPASNTVSFKNNYSSDLHYGNCQVTLRVPTKRELKDAKPDGILGELVDMLPKPWQKEIAFDETKYTDVDGVSKLPTPVFYQHLNQVVNSSRQKDVLIFVHGFNVDFDSAIGRLAQIARDMPFNGAIVAYSWPSQGGVDNYEKDGEVVDESIEPFMQFLDDLKTNLPSDTKVNLVVHSMGNRLAMRSISQLVARDELITKQNPQRFENIVLCAPDVGVAEFKRLGTQVIEAARHTTLYRCLNDSALIASSYRNGEERAGGSYSPVILKGLDTVECAVIDTSILGHSYYGSNPFMLRDMFCIIKESQKASERPWMKKQKIPFEGDMWIIGGWPTQLDWNWHFDSVNTPEILQAGLSETETNPEPQSGKILLSN